ncbi:MAG: hypothetical protein KF716_14265 [Anaerolineae bacterium]|nr:hypothetical protein [Anaerolineae bacterium]
MRQTAKFIAAQQLVRRLYEKDPKKLRDLLSLDHETLYETLNDLYYMWDHKVAGGGKWTLLSGEEREFTGSLGSMFVGRDGKPSGIFNLRLMAHPQDIEAAIKTLEKYFHLGRVSDPLPNRGGEGVRVYVTAKLSGKKR